MWGWGSLMVMPRVRMVSHVGVLRLFVMAGVAFGWIVGLGRFANSLPLGWIVFFLLFLLEWLGVYGCGSMWVCGWSSGEGGSAHVC